jgi:hypothetical protein
MASWQYLWKACTVYNKLAVPMESWQFLWQAGSSYWKLTVSMESWQCLWKTIGLLLLFFTPGLYPGSQLPPPPARGGNRDRERGFTLGGSHPTATPDLRSRLREADLKSFYIFLYCKKIVV